MNIKFYRFLLLCCAATLLMMNTATGQVAPFSVPNGTKGTTLEEQTGSSFPSFSPGATASSGTVSIPDALFATNVIKHIQGPAEANSILVVRTTPVANSVELALTQLGYGYDIIYDFYNWTWIDFSPYTTVIFALDGGEVNQVSLQKIRTDVIDAGKRAIFIGGSCWYNFAAGVNSYLVQNNTSNYCWDVSPGFTVVNPAHPLAAGVVSPWSFSNYSGYYQMRCTDPNVDLVAVNGANWPDLFYKNSNWPGPPSPGSGDLIWFINSPNDYYWGNPGDYAQLKQIIQNSILFINNPPLVQCPPNASRNNTPGQCYYSVSGTEFDATASGGTPPLTLSHNFGGGSSLSGVHLPVGNNTVIWTVTDANNLTATCSFTVAVTDNEPPRLIPTIIPSPSTYGGGGWNSQYSNVNFNGTGNTWAIVAPGAPVNITLHWNMYYVGSYCPNCITQHYLSMQAANFTACNDWGYDNGNKSYTFNAPLTPGVYYVTHSSSWWFWCYQFGNNWGGNQADNAIGYIIVGSNTTCPLDITRSAGNACSLQITAGIDVVPLDNCCIQSLTWQMTGATSGTGTGSLSAYTFNVGITTVSYLVNDCHSNSYSCNFNVTITSSALSITCPQNAALCAPVNQNSVTVNNLAYQINGCGSGGLSTFYIVSGATSRIGWTPDASGVFNVGYNSVSYTVSDIAGNSVSCSFSVEVFKHTTANAGPDINSCVGTPIYVVGNIPTHGTMLWEQLSGPSTVSIAQPANYATYVSNLVAGTYVLRYTITHGFCSSSDEMQIIVGTGASPANAGPDQMYCGSTQTAVMAATPPATGIGMWSQMSGPTTVSISSLFSPTASIGNLGTGVYVMKWSVTSGSCNPSIDYMTITIKPVMTVNAGPDVLFPANAYSYYIAGSSASNYNSLAWTKSGTGFFNNATILHPTYYPSAADKTLGYVDLTLTGFQTGCQQKSDVMRITFNKEAGIDPEFSGSFSANVMPNPFFDEANIEFTLPESGFLSLRIIDMNGRIAVMLLDRKEVNTPVLTEQIRAAGMAPGIYSWYAVFDGKEKQYFQSGRFMIAR